MTRAQVEPDVARQHRRFALFAGANALMAVAGAIALGTGATELSAQATDRLPFGSPVVGALALLFVVAGPLAFVSQMAWGGHYATTPAASLCGFMLIGWAVLQVVVVQEFNLFQPVYAVMGVGFVLWGYFNRPENIETARAERLHRWQSALEDIVAAVDPTAAAPTAEIPPGVDEIHAPGHRHRTS